MKNLARLRSFAGVVLVAYPGGKLLTLDAWRKAAR